MTNIVLNPCSLVCIDEKTIYVTSQLLYLLVSSQFFLFTTTQF
jgi:hypothetical protein